MSIWDETRGRGNTSCAVGAARLCEGTLVVATMAHAVRLRKANPDLKVVQFRSRAATTGPIFVDVTVPQAIQMELDEMRERLRKVSAELETIKQGQIRSVLARVPS